MQYTYTTFKNTNDDVGPISTRIDVTTNLDEITVKNVTDNYFVEIWSNPENRVINFMRNEDDLLAWRTACERAHTWKAKKPEMTLSDVIQTALKEESLHTPVSPKHYKDFVEGFQWIETMSRIPRYRDNPEAFKGAVEFQVRKYLDRNGRKDEELQELEKALWYLRFYVAYVKNGSKPLKISDIDSVLNK
jgi:hypothetical protein